MATEDDVPGGDLRQVVVTLEPEPDAEADEVERLGRQLRAELKQLDVESIKNSLGSAPIGAKGDYYEWTQLLVTLSSAGSVLPMLIDAIQSWLSSRHRGHRISVTIGGDTIELDGASPEERAELVDAYIARHS